MEYKSILEVASAKGRQVEAIITTLNAGPDRDGDTVRSGFFSHKPIETAVIPAHQWSHVPIAKALTWERHEQEVVSLMTFNGTFAASEWFEAIAHDFSTGKSPVMGWSWGFKAYPDAMTKTKSGRDLHGRRSGGHGIMLFEVSPCLVASSVGTRTTAIKSRDWSSAMLARIQQRRVAWRSRQR